MGPKTSVKQQSSAMLAWRVLVNYTRGPAIAATVLHVVASPIFEKLKVMWPLTLLNDAALFSALIVGVHILVFWSVCGTLLSCDKYGWLQQYKLPRTPAQNVPPEKIGAVVKGLLIEHLLSQPVTAFLGWYAFHYMGSNFDEPLPSWPRAFAIFSLCSFFNDLLFFATHRLLHTKALYKYHKKHHAFVGTIAIAAEYTHPIEGVAANTVSTLLTPLLLGVHPLVVAVWLMWRIERACETHSGYCFKGTFLSNIGLLNAEDAIYHDFHHTHNVGNYGVALGMEGYSLWDHVCGTQDAWIVHQAKQSQATK